jgi:hypothetical protein
MKSPGGTSDIEKELNSWEDALTSLRRSIFSHLKINVSASNYPSLSPHTLVYDQAKIVYMFSIFFFHMYVLWIIINVNPIFIMISYSNCMYVAMHACFLFLFFFFSGAYYTTRFEFVSPVEWYSFYMLQEW